MTIDGLMQPTPLTLHSIFERMATVHADGVIIDRGRGTRTTFGEIADRVRRLATVLTDDLGIRPGDRVASYTWNSRPHFELYWAVPLVGAVLHTANIRLYADQVAYTLNHAKNRAVFVHPDLTGAFDEVRPQLTTIERVVELGDEYEKLVADADPAGSFAEVPETAACGLCYTSGTTGMPKGVLSSHRALWLHSMATCMADSIGLSERDRVLPIVPMFHAFGWGLPYSAPFTGAELVLHGSDSTAENVANILSEEKVTVAAAVPTIWKELLPVLRRGDHDLSNLRLVFVGGSASPRSLIEAYEDLGIEYLQVWGMTETGPLACASRPRRRHRAATRDEVLDLKERTGTILPGLQARVVDDAGSPVTGTTAVGELEVRGPWIAAAYFDDDTSAEKFHDGWLRTGDMAIMDADGFFRIVDRAKDLVKSGGEWISSVELEGHILAHPDVADAAVVGLPSLKWDERPVAVVVAADGVEPTLESIHEFLADRVAKWWLPDQVVVVDEIPKTSVGKLDKKVLRTQLAHIELP